MQDFLWEELEQQFQNIRDAYRSKKIMLNNVVIEKSALYLRVENYIANVKYKSQMELQNQEEDNIGSKRKPRFQKNFDYVTEHLDETVQKFIESGLEETKTKTKDESSENEGKYFDSYRRNNFSKITLEESKWMGSFEESSDNSIKHTHFEISNHFEQSNNDMMRKDRSKRKKAFKLQSILKRKESPMQEIALTSVKFKDKIPINLFEDNLPSNTVKSPKTTSKRLRILENPDSQLKSKRRSDMKDRQIFDEEYAKASAKLKKVKHKKKIENKIENPSKEELYDEYKRSKLKEEQKDNTSNLSASPKKQKQRKKKKSRPSLKVASPQNETNVLTEIAQEHMEHHSPTQKSSEGDPQLMPKVTKKLTKIKLFESLSSLEHHPEINFYKKETDKHISHDLKSLESEFYKTQQDNPEFKMHPNHGKPSVDEDVLNPSKRSANSA